MIFYFHFVSLYLETVDAAGEMKLFDELMDKAKVEINKYIKIIKSLHLRSTLSPGHSLTASFLAGSGLYLLSGKMFWKKV